MIDMYHNSLRSFQSEHIESKQVNSGTDTIRSTSSSQYQRERQTNTIKQSQMNRWQTALTTLSPKRWQLCYQNLTKYIYNLRNS